MKTVRYRIKTLFRFLYYGVLYRCFWIFKIDTTKIIFSAFNGKHYSGNPKAIYEKYISKPRKKTYVWVYDNNEQNPIPGDPIIVQPKSIRYLYHLATAKYWIMNANLDPLLEKRHRQFFLQTWHGIPLKHICADIENNTPNDTFSLQLNNWLKDAARWDVLLSPDKETNSIFQRAFRIDPKIIKTVPYPRNWKLLQEHTDEEILKMKRKHKIPTDRITILYAPTYREGEFSSTIALDVPLLKEHVGDRAICLLKMHPHIKDIDESIVDNSFCYKIAYSADIHEILLITDILITDYSSIFYDFKLLDRPMVFFPYDYDSYIRGERSFYHDYHTTVPGPVCMTSEEVVRELSQIISELDTSH